MPRRSRRWLTIIAAGAAMFVSAFAFSSTASAYPPGTAVTLTVSTTNPAVGGSLTVGGTNWKPGTTIDITLHTATYTLGSATAGSDGSFSTTVTLPAGVSGSHTIVGMDPATGESASVAIMIGTSGAPSGGGGGLAATGVAVMSIGGVGVLLLIGGGVMLMVGKRRRASA